MKRIKIDTFPKILVSLIILHGFINIDLSYILAFLGRETVSDVSTVLVSEVVAPVVTYLACNLIANIFEKNKLSFSVPLDSRWIMNKEDAEEYEEQVD